MIRGLNPDDWPWVSALNAANETETSPLTEARYRNGIESFLSSLDAQRSYYAAQRTLVLSRLIAATNLVDIYEALGGDSLLSQPSPSATG